ncbi:STAS-like domain-containing protein [Polaromonas sp.]|uniref:STAS-like domain-containing protein n=1 Tax=Polaromonas sp. TaxID=1869339 RepID=UPI002FCABC8F
MPEFAPFQLGREKDRITISGTFAAQDVRRVLAAIHDAVNKRGYSEVELDFSRCTSAFSAAMLPLCAHALQLRSNRIDFRLVMPASERLARLFDNTGWSNFLCPRDHETPRRNGLGKQFPAAIYTSHEQQDMLLNELLEKLLAVIPNFNRTAFAAVEWALNEITDNVTNHSQSSIGGLLQLSVFDVAKQKVEFTVADAGLGVAQTLRSAKPEIASDVDALLQAVRSGVTRNAKDFQGNGLYGTLEICRAGGGRFTLNAGHAALICANGTVQAKNEPIPYTGTTVDALIDFSVPSLLEKALAIDGVVHKPVDYIELKYEQDDLKAIPFRVREQALSFRSRPAGRPVRTKLANLIENCPGQILFVDFENITVVSSSFADEVFGKLFVELGPMRFMQTVRLINVSPTVQALIDRAIKQRMQNPAITDYGE